MLSKLGSQVERWLLSNLQFSNTECGRIAAGNRMPVCITTLGEGRPPSRDLHARTEFPPPALGSPNSPGLPAAPDLKARATHLPSITSITSGDFKQGVIRVAVSSSDFGLTPLKGKHCGDWNNHHELAVWLSASRTQPRLYFRRRDLQGLPQVRRPPALLMADHVARARRLKEASSSASANRDRGTETGCVRQAVGKVVGFAGMKSHHPSRRRRWCVEGIFMSSRYLATVRRVSWIPCAWSIAAS